MEKHLKKLYPTTYLDVKNSIQKMISKYKKNIQPIYEELSEKDVLMISYADSFTSHDETTFKTMKKFYQNYLKEIINIIHILPFYPYSSDDGFSVIDFRRIENRFGSWSDIADLQKHVDLMFDLVANHVSVQSDYFKKYLQQEPGYETFFYALDPGTDLSKVTRPRTSGILTPFTTVNGVKHVWTTFSPDQVDLNYQDPNVLLEVLDVLMFYIFNGSRLIRLDAIGFIWKKIGTTCMHLEEAHTIIKIMRFVVDQVSSQVKMVTETNVKHIENISYFGNGNDEASLVYQFPLPPLVLNAYITKNVKHLSSWLNELPKTASDTTFFNFLSSHDGIGLRPVEGIIDDFEIEMMIDVLSKRGAKINYRTLADGSKSAYECCITYTDALTDLHDSDDDRAKKLLGAHRILLSLQGLPAIYYHTLLGSRNDELGYEMNHINRRINREKLDYYQLTSELETHNHLRQLVFTGMRKMIMYRKSETLFHPNVAQCVLDLNEHVFALLRYDDHCEILTLVNLSDQTIDITISAPHMDVLTLKLYHDVIHLDQFGSGWFKKL